jgi:hypothetical protein
MLSEKGVVFNYLGHGGDGLSSERIWENQTDKI